MKPNEGKCHILVADINHKKYSSDSYIYHGNVFLENEKSVKLLGVHIDQNLNFEGNKLSSEKNRIRNFVH